MAPRHLSAIHALGGRLLAACDPHDSVGVLDRYFPGAHYVRSEEELFSWQASRGEPPDFVSICTPNDQHERHIRQALLGGSAAICEKPLVLSPSHLRELRNLQQSTGRAVHPVLQLREHPELLEMKRHLDQEGVTEKEVDLTYITARGPWYHVAWKGQRERSGGLVFAIGIHFVDLLLWLFGPASGHKVFLRSSDKMAGEFELERARVRWFLSVDPTDLPATARSRGATTHRCLSVNGEEVEFSGKFDDLHEQVYLRICEERGLTLDDAAPSISLATMLSKADLHPALPTWLRRHNP